ncbi:MAG: hypothetical protein ACR2NM_15025 [Bythopirellula sp.]
MSPTDPRSAEFSAALAASGESFGRVNVAAIYCVHGTFVGNDMLGLFTELSRFAPSVSKSLSRCGKRVVDFVTGEAGNYTREFTSTLESELSRGAGRTISVRLFNWSSQNNHIARADGAIRLIDELARLAIDRDGAETERVQLWAHSHGGNVLALVSQLIGADQAVRDEFFESASCFYQSSLRQSVDMPLWPRVRELLSDAEHPLRRLALDMITFGTPIRYGWNAGGYAKLLHFIHHRPPPEGEAYQAPIPLKLLRACQAKDGDYVQQFGISGTNIVPCPLAVRTFLANRRLDQLLEPEEEDEGIVARLRRAQRVSDEGTTLLVDYSEVSRWPHRHLAGHALYTRRKWLPFHCREIAQRLYCEEENEG